MLYGPLPPPPLQPLKATTGLSGPFFNHSFFVGSVWSRFSVTALHRLARQHYARVSPIPLPGISIAQRFFAPISLVSLPVCRRLDRKRQIRSSKIKRSDAGAFHGILALPGASKRYATRFPPRYSRCPPSSQCLSRLQRPLGFHGPNPPRSPQSALPLIRYPSRNHTKPNHGSIRQAQF
jgi:hypothetical protein